MKTVSISLLLLFCLPAALIRAEEMDMHHALEESEERAPMPMSGLYGRYMMTREASGTSWQPESTPMQAIHFMGERSMTMIHGFANAVYDKQGGRRGGEKAFSTNMLMLMTDRQTDAGTFGFRGMLTLEPAMGKEGYPLLMQTGETADGRTPLVDRQHPHDLLMELALTYSLSFENDSSAFAYFGYPGEPALGPPVFMHRFSGEPFPDAPITHHWLDSTHVTYGVGTVGYAIYGLKFEGSLFTGREPDENRWDVEKPRFDSWSGRLSLNPGENWALQASYGHLVNPEQLFPGFNEDRITASAIYNHPQPDGNFQTTLAWGRNLNEKGHILDAYLLESAISWGRRSYLFARGERVEEDELLDRVDPEGNTAYLALNPNGFGAPVLFPHPQIQNQDGTSGVSPSAAIIRRVFAVGKVSVGFLRNVAEFSRCRLGVGAVGSLYFIPDALNPVYGESPGSIMIYARLTVGS